MKDLYTSRDRRCASTSKRMATCPTGLCLPQAGRGCRSTDTWPTVVRIADGVIAFLRLAQESGGFTLQPQRPHFQTVTCNASNGGLNRWYEPFSKEIVKGASLKTILDAGRHFVEQLCSNRTWHIEAHQFRIEVFADEVGKPTPEGVHRDGVGFVLVMMINRTNVLDGETTIYPNSNGDALAHFTLLQPFDVLLLADSEVRHNVNPIVARDPARPGMRDVLVVTFSTTQR